MCSRARRHDALTFMIIRMSNAVIRVATETEESASFFVFGGSSGNCHEASTWSSLNSLPSFFLLPPPHPPPSLFLLLFVRNSLDPRQISSSSCGTIVVVVVLDEDKAAESILRIVFLFFSFFGKKGTVFRAKLYFILLLPRHPHVVAQVIPTD